MQKSGSTRKERGTIINLENNMGEAKADRSMILKTATKFFEKLYGRDKEEEKVMTKGQREGEENEIEEAFPEIMEWEVEDEINKLKVGKAPGADRTENEMLKD